MGPAASDVLGLGALGVSEGALDAAAADIGRDPGVASPVVALADLRHDIPGGARRKELRDGAGGTDALAGLGGALEALGAVRVRAPGAAQGPGLALGDGGAELRELACSS